MDSFKRLFDTEVSPGAGQRQSGSADELLQSAVAGQEMPAAADSYLIFLTTVTKPTFTVGRYSFPIHTESDMALERTLSIIKPDAVAKNVVGQIYGRFENAGLRVVAAKMKQLSRKEAEGFYAVHRERPFFNALVDFMISGPVMIQVLEGESAVMKNRELMGATNPKDAAPGTIRADFADSIDANAVHGSDAAETAAVEIAYFFAATELCAR
jgi:nucleoside-diphosphate kinase